MKASSATAIAAQNQVDPAKPLPVAGDSFVKTAVASVEPVGSAGVAVTGGASNGIRISGEPAPSLPTRKDRPSGSNASVSPCFADGSSCDDTICQVDASRTYASL